MKRKVTWNDVMDFKLQDNPIIFDLGGYKGDWVQEALNRFHNPTIYVFEPVKRFYEIIKKRYSDNPNIKVYNLGLSDVDKIVSITVDENKSSHFIEGSAKEEIEIKDIKKFLFEEKIFHVDLIKINIEGEEYNLLEHLTELSEITVFKNYLIQFHPFVPNYQERRSKICDNLSTYFTRTFNFEMIFEGWTIKNLKKINCVGDSHVSIFANHEKLVPENELTTYKNFTVFRSGPTLAHNIKTKKNIGKFLSHFSNDEELLFCFGEIDCRAQVHRFIDANTNYQTVINNTLENYISYIKSINNKNIILFGITPELKENPHQYYYRDHPEVFDCPKGALAERSSYKDFFNKRLKEISLENNWKFISIYDHIKNQNKIDDVYYLDDIHLKGNYVHYLIEYEFLKMGFSNMILSS